MVASPCRRAAKGGLQGFSLVELLVATTILLVIVAMTSMVFQQANGAFQSGTRRVKTQSVMRTVSGAIMHDLAFLVDSDRFPGAPGNDFSGKKIRFIASGGESKVVEGDEEVVVYRPYRCITYSFSGNVVKRLEQPLVQDGRNWSAETPDGMGSGGVSLNDPLTDPINDLTFSAIWPEEGGSDTIPLRVDIHIEKETTGNATYASARSAGPDKEFDTDDDIWAGEPPFAE